MSRYCVANVRNESARDLGEAEGRKSRRILVGGDRCSSPFHFSVPNNEPAPEIGR